MARLYNHLPGKHNQMAHGTRVGHFHVKGEGDRKFYRTTQGNAVSMVVRHKTKAEKAEKRKRLDAKKLAGRKVKR